MKLNKEIVAKDGDTKLRISISIETKNLVGYEAKQKLSNIVSRVHDGLRSVYQADEIRIKAMTPRPADKEERE